MALDNFKSDGSKAASTSKSTGPTEDALEQFIEQSKKENIEVEGGFEIPGDVQEEYDTEVVKIFGGPGTGKTTTMVGNGEIDDFKGILQRKFEENPPGELMLVAYTRAAADEAKNRLAKLTSVNQTTLDDRITTIHSLAMGFNGLTPKDIVEIRWNNDKKDFCDSVGLNYNPQSGEDREEMMAAPDDEGHVFFRINSWLKSSLKRAEEWEDCPLASEWDRSSEEFIKISKLWGKYKNENNIWEFDDAILESVKNEDTVDANKLFIDEVQDLYPLQQEFIENQFGHVERLYLAGDDDQTIYEWAGADPSYFLNMDPKINDFQEELWEDKAGYWHDEGNYILDQSWRMPDEVLKLAKICISQVSQRQEKEIKPLNEGGNFIPLYSPDVNHIIEHINPDSTKILFRANYQIENFSDNLIEAGVPFEDKFNTWSDDVVKVRNAIAAIKNGKRGMSGEEAAELIRHLPDDALSNSNKRSSWAKSLTARRSVEMSTLMDMTRYAAPEKEYQIRRWLNEFEDFNWYQERAIKNNIIADREHMTPDGIKLQTIHSSKGQEAETVILSLSSTRSVMENMEGEGISDAERRLYYVGMTRTEDTLVMVESLDPDSPTITIDQLLGEKWREYYDWENKPVYEQS